MEEIPIAYPILDQYDKISTINIIYTIDYDFVIKYKVDDFIEITLRYSYGIYQQLITKSDIELGRLYKLIINSLNKEPNYLIDINLDNNIILDISFNNDMIDINQQIQLIKQLDQKSTELLLLDKVKELEKRIESIEKIQSKRIHIDDNYYDINTTDLDLSIIGFNSKYELDDTLNKFTNLTTIIINGGLVEYLLTPIKDSYDYRNNINTITIIGGNVDIQLVLNYCCTLAKDQSIIIKNAGIIYHIKGGAFYFMQNYKNNQEKYQYSSFVRNHKLYDMLSNLKINLKIIFENVSCSKQTYTRINGEEFKPTGVSLSNFQEFITTSELEKYNIFQNN